MKILLIGHEGYLGRGLFAFLRRRHEVLGWDKKEDLFNLEGAWLARQNIEMLINLSVVADRQSRTFQAGAPTDHINVIGARHLAKVLKGSQIAWIQMSTREVFGPVYKRDDVVETAEGYRGKFLVNEECPYAPQNFYGKSKVMAEFISESHPCSDVIRLTTCYTDYDHPAGNWVTSLIRAAVHGKPVTLTQGGLQFRDPLHIDDLGRMMELLCEKKVYGHKIHAGGGDKNMISLLEFVRIANPGVKVETASGGDYGFGFDITKAQQLIGWQPEILVRERIPLVAENIRRGISEPPSAT
jgi:nucleoside-diphosphate-sugar epimerase